jgi:multidrug efflux pump subunit AcrA (membrane-fusion protein)
VTVATIRIQLDDKTAQLLAATPAEQRAQLNLLIRNLIEQFAGSTPTALLALMDEMSREASRNGMTPELLDAILNDE